MGRDLTPPLRRAGIPRIRLHDLRHACASLHLKNGTHPRVVQQMLGHANVGVTLQVYSHLLSSMGKEAAARLHSLLEGSAE